jgi:Carboxypeptidase regulatory-like domain/TonB dependent receptor
MLRSKLICVVGLLLLVVSGTIANQAAAQAVYGSILGTVTDPQGASVAGATITVTSVGKNVTTTATSNESGNYSVTHLSPDVYTLRIEAKGFKSVEHKGIVVSADSGSRIDAQFTLGGASETVEVTAEAAELKTDRADVAIEFTTKQISELPILNRNFQSLELLTPGTQTLTGWAHAATENPQGSKQIFVDGQHFSGTGYLLDGTDNQDPILGIIIVNSSLDTVTETKMTTANYDAEFGKATAGLMSAQTKSGSNGFHGSGYFYDLNPKGPAKDPFSGAPSSSTWKQFGGAVGGPIIKNKLFFFFGYEANRRSAGISILATVPTAFDKANCLAPGLTVCDLSDYSNANLGGGAGAVFNPYQAAGSRQTYTTGTPGSFVTQIPFSALQQWDPTGVAEKILNLLPAPNAPGTNVDPVTGMGTVNNYSAGGSGSFNDYQYTTREDYNASQKLQIFGRYTHAHFSLSGSPMFGNTIGGPGLGYLGLAGQSNINNYSLATGFNYTLSNTLLTDVRFGYFRYNPHSTKWDAGNATAASSLGLVGLNNPSDATTNGLPALFFEQTIGQTNQGGSEHGLGESLNTSRCNCPLIEKEQGYQFANNWTKIVGNHQIKIGADLRHASNLRVPSDANRTGQLNFHHLTTSDGLGSPTGGLDIATYLFGAVSNFDRYVGSAGEPNAIETQNRYFVYAQDTLRATHKLTLNYGIRWEFYSPESVNAKGNGGFAVLPQGVIRVAGYDGISNNGNTHANFKSFAPRFGVAYEVNPKTVVRMGYGRSFDIGVFGSNFGHTVTQNLPVLAHQSLVSPTNDNKTIAFNFVGTCLPASGGYDPTICGPASGTAAFPIIPSDGILPFFGPTGTVSPHVRPDRVVVPTVDAWNITVQRQISSKSSLEIAYIGTHGSHVFKGDGPTYNTNQATVVNFDVVNPANPIDPSTGLPGVWTYNQRSPYNTAFTTPYTDANGVTTQVVCCSGQGINIAGNDGSNSYKAFQVKWNQKASNGLTILAHYTYSRAYDNDGSYQPNLRTMWGRSDFNRNSVLVFTSIYELPFGRGKKYYGNIGRAADAILGGWQWNSAIIWGSGLPWTPSYNNCNLDRDTGPCRPTLAGNFHDGIHGRGNQVTYFTPASTSLCDSPDVHNGIPVCPTIVTRAGAFGAPGVGNFGTIQRNSFTGPGEFKADMSIFKNFTITESVKAQFQAEFFNVFNHPVYAFNVNQTGSGTCIDCGGAGQINSTEGNGAPTMRQFQFGIRVTF